MKTISWGWILWLHFVNCGGIFIIYGAIELIFYVRRKQDTRFKYNHRFLSEQPSDVFWFKSQNIDNFPRTFLISIPIWTLIMSFPLWCSANGYVLWLSPESHWALAHGVNCPCSRDTRDPLLLFSLADPSGIPLQMGPLGAPQFGQSVALVVNVDASGRIRLLFFSDMMLHLVVPSNPFVALFQLTTTAYGSVVGHIGFDRLEMTDKRGVATHAYTRYLHHRYFEVNYGGDGLVPLDKWFGTCHDGTSGSDERMKERLSRKRARAAVRQAARVLRVVNEAKHRGVAVIFINHQVLHALAAGDHFTVLFRGAVAADFRKGEKSREEITDLMAGGDETASLEEQLVTNMNAGEDHATH